METELLVSLKGIHVPTWDAQGNFEMKQTDNPAWIALNILIRFGYPEQAIRKDYMVAVAERAERFKCSAMITDK